MRGNLSPARLRSSFVGSIPACAGEPVLYHSPPVTLGVYPRVCGGTRNHVPAAGIAMGLSPRVRGNHDAACVRSSRCGSIPACAGEPRPTARFQTIFGVYPRVCGGTIDRIRLCSGCRGLSPRVRGNPRASPVHLYSPGSIPACAGEPQPGRTFKAWRRVYPRVCGGTQLSRCTGRLLPGLSPRVRGNRHREVVSQQ